MGFGAIIASGERNNLLPDRLIQSITEVRVEQSLDDMTQFAIRFEEDICGGEPMLIKEPELKCERMITIAVEEAGALKCLVRGPITDIKWSIKLGGPGSWYEIRGKDRRIELDRECIPHVESGFASSRAKEILGKTFDKANVETTKIKYGGKPVKGRKGRQTISTLNMRSSHDAFIRRIARTNNLHYWIEYGCKDMGQSLKVEETVNLKSSPPRPKDAPADPVSVDQIKLVPTVSVKLRVNVDKEQCQNVTGFELSMNPERPNRFKDKAIDSEALEIHDVQYKEAPQPVIVKGGLRLDFCENKRDVCITTAGNPEELNCKAESVLTEAGWFLQATANTTAHMLGGVLMPHDVIDVEGLCNGHDGPYQVQAVTHVINAADHFMDIQLRRNAIGGD